MVLWMASYAYLRLSNMNKHAAFNEETDGADVQDILKLAASLRDEVKVCPVQISLKRLVGSASRGKGLVEGRVVLVPREPVFSVGGCVLKER